MLDHLRTEQPHNPDRIIVTGFSLDGGATWFYAANHPDRFAAAIAIASRPVLERGTDFRGGLQTLESGLAGNEPPWLAGLMRVPLYLVNSRTDQLIPFAQASRATDLLAARGAPVELTALDGFGHFETARYVEPLRAAVRKVFGLWESQRP